MSDTISDIATKLKQVEWRKKRGKRTVTGFPEPVPEGWPLSTTLNKMIEMPDAKGKCVVGEHVKGVIASINTLTLVDDEHSDKRFEAAKFLRGSRGDRDAGNTRLQMDTAFSASWRKEGGMFRNSEADLEYSKALLLVAALYHDVGKSIGSDRHVTRGVHLMMDMSDNDRTDVESLFGTFDERRDFWALLRHHDIFGNLSTGEASLPALVDMASWTESSSPPHDRLRRQLTYLFWLNMADMDNSINGGVTCDSVAPSLVDWGLIQNHLKGDNSSDEKPPRNSRTERREDFKRWLLEKECHPERTIERITRLVATCCGRAMRELDREKVAPVAMIRSIVERELQALHGPRLEQFSYLFARFCKLEYALGFFTMVTWDSFIEERFVSFTSGGKYPFPKGGKDKNVRRGKCWSSDPKAPLADVVKNVCLILGRIVQEYGHLVIGDERAMPRIAVEMSGLERPNGMTAYAICRALRKTPSRGLWWIMDEIGVRLYGE